MTLALLCAGLIATATPADDTPPAETYHEARARAGKTPDDQVRLALWCESHGLKAERLRHLALAIMADPAHATARGLLGLVSRDGRWQSPDAVAAGLKADPAVAATLAEYDVRRQKAAYTADGQWALGVWADEHGLKEQARAHFTAVVRLDPSRDNAWRRLGFKKLDGRWTTDAQSAADHAEREARKQADLHWRPVLERHKANLLQPSRRDEALAALAEVTDPRAVAMIAKVFITEKSRDQQIAVQMLGQVEAPAASRVLAGLAVFGASAEVRRSAVETLKHRDPRDFVRLWIALVRKPIKYEVRKVGGPGSPGTLFVEGDKANVRRVYAPPPIPEVPNIPGATIGYDANGLPVIDLDLSKNGIVGRPGDNASLGTAATPGQAAFLARFAQDVASGKLQAAASALDRQAQSRPATTPRNGIGARQDAIPVYSKTLEIPIGEMVREAQAAAVLAERQLEADVASIDRTNAVIRRQNEPTLVALRTVTGGDYGDDGPAWARWWTDQEGYAMTGPSTTTVPTFVDNVPLNYVPTTSTTIIQGDVIGYTARHHSCFAAGTPVRTIDGPRSIESIRAGDVVLTQDTRSGALEFQPVVAVFHNPPSPTLQIHLDAETVVSTGIHRFWKAGKGWTMARDLKPGDTIRTLGGTQTVRSVEADKTMPVFNLEVAHGRSFFVGENGVLVHDNSLVEATPNPFDGEPKVVAKVTK